jgi:hypothetical protein
MSFVDRIERASSTDARAIVPLGLSVGEWYAAELTLPSDDTLNVVFRERSGGDEVIVTILPRDTRTPVLKRLRHCALRYTARIRTLTAERRAEVSALILTIGTTIDERLSDGRSIAEALGADRSPRRVVFGREMLRAFLEPEIAEGVAFASGWTLHDVYPASNRRLVDQDELELVVEIRRDLRRLLFSVGRASDRPALVRTKNFSVVEIVGARGDSEDVQGVRTLLSFIFQLRDHEHLTVGFPSVVADLGLRALPAATDVPRVDGSLNLALDAECGQQCAFCSVKAANPAYDGGDATYGRALSDLEASREKGIRHLRLNGYDPLAYSRVLDVLAAARDLGFDRVDVFSPCTRLADRAFCAELVELLPTDRSIHVPLYAMTADVHDRFVGRPGAHALVMQAIANLLELAGPEVIRVLSVVANDNLAELADVHRFARASRISFSAHTPYPMNEGRDDRFFAVAAKQSDVARLAVEIHESLGAGRHDVPIFGVAPCVTFRAFGERGITPWQWLAAGEIARLPGTEYDREDIEHGAGDRATGAYRVSTIKCPHVAKCALVSVCGGSLLRAYVERHGADEFAPIELRTLVEATVPRD